MNRAAAHCFPVVTHAPLATFCTDFVAKRPNRAEPVGCLKSSEDHMKRMLSVVFFSALCLFVADVFAAPTVTQMTLVNEVRVGRTVFDLTYRITVQNDDIERTGLMLVLKNVGQGSVILDGTSIVGDLAPGATASTDDTITIRHDRVFPFSSAAFEWDIGGAFIGSIGALKLLYPPTFLADEKIPIEGFQFIEFSSSSTGQSFSVQVFPAPAPGLDILTWADLPGWPFPDSWRNHYIVTLLGTTTALQDPSTGSVIFAKDEKMFRITNGIGIEAVFMSRDEFQKILDSLEFVKAAN
jgi:hypothetical protein